MNSEQKTLAYLQTANDSICDDCLGLGLGIDRHYINALCRQLQAGGRVLRERDYCSYCGAVSKLCNSFGLRDMSSPQNTPINLSEQETERPWFWEGNIQRRLVLWLEEQGFTVKREANTATREAGVDIVAVGSTGRELWVSVKGWPVKSKYTQARHWFAGAIFDIAVYWNTRQDVDLAIALPAGFATYSKLAAKISRLSAAIPFDIFWVPEADPISISRAHPQ